MVVVGVKGAGSEVQRWEVKESPNPKTKGHQLEVFLYSATKSHSAASPSFQDDQRT